MGWWGRARVENCRGLGGRRCVQWDVRTGGHERPRRPHRAEHPYRAHDPEPQVPQTCGAEHREVPASDPGEPPGVSVEEVVAEEIRFSVEVLQLTVGLPEIKRPAHPNRVSFRSLRGPLSFFDQSPPSSRDTPVPSPSGRRVLSVSSEFTRVGIGLL